MASSAGSSTASTSSVAYDLTAVKLLVASSTTKATLAVITALLPLISEKISPAQLADRVSLKQSEPATVSNKTQLNSNVKVQRVYKKLTEATMEQMKIPMGGTSIQPIMLFSMFTMEVNGRAEAIPEFLDTSILPIAIELTEAVQKAQPAALDDVDLWKTNSEKQTPSDEKKTPNDEKKSKG